MKKKEHVITLEITLIDSKLPFETQADFENENSLEKMGLELQENGELSGTSESFKAELEGMFRKVFSQADSVKIAKVQTFYHE